MRTLVWSGGLGLLAAALLAGARADGGKEVEVRRVKLADVGKAVKGLKGKVVVVEYWAEF